MATSHKKKKRARRHGIFNMIKKNTLLTQNSIHRTKKKKN